MTFKQLCAILVSTAFVACTNQPEPEQPTPVAQGLPKPTPTHRITTIAGAGTATSSQSDPILGYRNAQGKSARLKYPIAVARDSRGNFYVAENGNGQIIRKVTPDGQVTLFAGTARPELFGGTFAYVTDGPPGVGTFSDLRALEFGQDDTLYVADDNYIRRVDPTGRITTVVGGTNYGTAPLEGPASSVRGGTMMDLAWWRGELYFIDFGEKPLIRKFVNGQVSTVAGGRFRNIIDGLALNAHFNFPRAIGLQPSTGYVTISETQQNLLRNIAVGRVYTFYDAYSYERNTWRRKDDLWQLELNWISRIQYETDTTILVLSGSRSIWRLNLQTHRGEMVFPLDHALYCARRPNLTTSVCDEPRCSPFEDGLVQCSDFGYVEDFLIESDSTMVIVDRSTHSLRRITRLRK